MVVLRAAVVLLVIGWILDIPGRLQIGLFTEQILAAVLGLSLALTFLTFPLSMARPARKRSPRKSWRRRRRRSASIDVLLAAAALISCFYVAVRYPELIVELVTRPWYGILVAAVIVLLVFEASRRVTGLSLVLIVLALCAHAMFGYLLPEIFAARPVALSRLIVYLGIDTNALLGITLQIAVVVVVPFIIMGQVLARCGGSDFFADLAAALMGRFRGGAAKIAVVGSAFFGMISGSAVANVASVGTITIPLMKRAGFPPHIAAGDRSGRLDRRPDRAAGDGRRRLPDGRVSAGALRRGDARRDHSGVPVLRRAVHPGRSGIGEARHPRRAERNAALRSARCCARAGTSSSRSPC